LALIKDGYFQDTYWASKYWQEDYWPEYGTAVAPAVTPSVRGELGPLIPKPEFPPYLLLLIYNYLKSKVG
jgi:hypothetical protein